MGIQSASLPLGATFAPTGGVATTLTPDGTTVPNGIRVVVATDTTAATRRNATLKARSAVINSATGKFSGKDKRAAVFCIPEILADGSITFDLVRVEIECHPQSASTKLAALKSAGLCMLADADFDNFWQLGSTV